MRKGLINKGRSIKKRMADFDPFIYTKRTGGNFITHFKFILLVFIILYVSA